MLVLDTNVVSELMRATPEPRVVDWVDRQLSSHLRLTSLTAAELRAGVALLPKGRRRERVRAEIDELLDATFLGYILPFDHESANHYADIVAVRRAAGEPMPVLDCQIAAICRQYGAALATRNVADFARTGIEVVNPWATAPA